MSDNNHIIVPGNKANIAVLMQSLPKSINPNYYYAHEFLKKIDSIFPGELARSPVFSQSRNRYVGIDINDNTIASPYSILV